MRLSRSPSGEAREAQSRHAFEEVAVRFGPRIAWVSIAIAALALLTASCADEAAGPPDPPNESNDRIEITNDEGTLDERVSGEESDVPIDPVDGSGQLIGTSASVQAASSALSLRLESEVSPPTVEGEVVQATAVEIYGSKVRASYNMRGEPRFGAVDLISTSTLSRPRLTASATFNDSDVSAIGSDGSFVYLAAATGTAGFEYPAVLERMRVKNDKITLEDNLRLPLSSYVGTSALATNDYVYATSGDGGHVFAFDRSSMQLLGQYPLDDARWVAWDPEGGRLVVVQGTPGRISVFAEGSFPGGSMTLLNTFPFPGADVPESKSTIEISGGKAFIAAGPAGVQIVCLDNGQVVGSVPRPDPAALGLDPSVVVTNAVTVDEDVLFISNGEAGIYVARGSRDFDQTACGETQQITVLGKLRFDDLQSANHIDFKNRWLAVAAGLGGVKLVRVSGL